jgi:hypothetical protein
MDQRGGVVQLQEGDARAPGGRPNAAGSSGTAAKNDAGRAGRPGSFQEVDGSGCVGDGRTDDEIAAKVGSAVPRLGDDDVGDRDARSRHHGAEDPAAESADDVLDGDHVASREKLF